MTPSTNHGHGKKVYFSDQYMHHARTQQPRYRHKRKRPTLANQPKPEPKRSLKFMAYTYHGNALTIAVNA